MRNIVDLRRETHTKQTGYVRDFQNTSTKHQLVFPTARVMRRRHSNSHSPVCMGFSTYSPNDIYRGPLGVVQRVVRDNTAEQRRALILTQPGLEEEYVTEVL